MVRVPFIADVLKLTRLTFHALTVSNFTSMPGPLGSSRDHMLLFCFVFNLKGIACDEP